MNYELAIDEDGEPFAVPPQVWGWRVRRAAEGRGRPVLVHHYGKPLIVRANASHADLLAAAGPGRYRLEAVDEHQHKIEGIPTACTGPLMAEHETSSDEPDDVLDDPPPRAASASTLEETLCRVVTANTRMVEKALGQMGTVMTGVAELLHAAHSAGITSRPPAEAPLPPPVPSVAPREEMDEDEEQDDDADDEHEGADDHEGAEPAQPAAPSSGVSDWVRLIIKETIERLVPLLVDKLTAGGGLGGLPLEAFADWRKAAPKAATAAPAPSAVTSDAPPPPANAPSSPATAPASHAAVPSSPPAPHPAVPSSPPAPHAHQPPLRAAHPPDLASGPPAPPAAPGALATPVVAGAAPSPTPPLGAASAERPGPLAGAVPRNPEELAAAVNAHILQVWKGLTSPERTQAGQLIARLSSDERTAWLAELAGLAVPDAIARARAFLQAQPPPNAPLPTATP